MAQDRYPNFAELTLHERAGVDFRIRLTIRPAPVAIVGPHGGKIEPGTSEIAAAIAGDGYSLYCFERLRSRRHPDLHITSTNFDEPKCLDLLARSDLVVTVHGLAGNHERVDVGGRDRPLRDAICSTLTQKGFGAQVVETGSHAAKSPGNICNKGRRGSGVQLEITRGLRDALLKAPQRMGAFANAVRLSITEVSVYEPPS